MSLGLPEFGSRGPEDTGRGVVGALRVLGGLALVYTVAVAAFEWRSASIEDAARDRAKADVAHSTHVVEDARRALQRNPDILVATASLESSPVRVTEDLNAALPDGVVVSALKIEYLPEGVAHLDITVAARSPQAYDRFLGALSRSKNFGEIKPGAEIRPGFVRATVIATHRPGGRAR